MIKTCIKDCLCIGERIHALRMAAASTGVKRSQTETKQEGVKKTKIDLEKWIELAKPEAPIDTVKDPLKPEYAIGDDEFRRVKPYFFKFTSFCKGRWVGRKLVDVLNKELHPRSPTHFDKLIELGRILVNKKMVAIDYELKDNDLIENLSHRHENLVLNQPIQIVLEDENVLVVNKPCSIPVHPCGRYRHNSLIMLLKWEHGYENLRILHRLDRGTSGLVILCKNLRTSQRLEKEFRLKQVKKTYVCEVEGDFPEGDISCDKPIDALCRKMGLHGITEGGKASLTRFQRLLRKKNSTIVKCFPETGRTHQIRVHLQYLGYPIINDGIYNSDVFGPEKGKGGEFGKSHEQLIADLWAAHNAKIHYLDDSSIEAYENAETEIPMPTESELAEINLKDSHYDPFCVDCRLKFNDPSVEELCLNLHCVEYEGHDWKYATEMPNWAK